MKNAKSKISKSSLGVFVSLFKPSSQGIVLYVFLSGMAIVLNQFEVIKKYLQLPHDLRITRTLAGWADHVLTNTIGASRTETLVVGLFWAGVGLAVYFCLRGLSRLVIEFDDDLDARSYIWPKGVNRDRPLREFAEKTAFRAFATVGLIVVALGPLTAMLRGPVFVDFLGSNQVLQYVVWFFAGCITWHIVTVLLRLIALRARLFG